MADSIRAVHDNETLREFWLKGEPIINPDPKGHYFKWTLPKGYVDNRWQFLDCDANPPRSEWPRKLGKMELNVYAIGYYLPENPGEMLIYAWSPLKTVRKASIEIPQAGSVQLEVVTPSGNFYIVHKKA